MKKLVITLFICITHFSIAQNIEKDLGDFTSLKTFDNLSVKLIKADYNKAVISGEHASEVQLINKDGLLKIRLEIDESYQGEDTYVTLYYKNLYVLDANEGSRIASEETLKAIDLELRTQEGASIRVAVDVKRLTAKAVSGSQIKVSGTAKNQDVTVNSGGMYKANKLNTEQTEVTVSAGGNAKVHATELVKAKVRAGGNIRVYGNPKVVDKKTVIGGTITIVN